MAVPIDDLKIKSEETEEAVSADEFLNEPMQKVMLSPHPLGGIRVAVWDRAGSQYVEQRIDLGEATIFSAHLQALLTMTFQTIYAQQAQLEQQAKSGLIVPR